MDPQDFVTGFADPNQPCKMDVVIVIVFLVRLVIYQFVCVFQVVGSEERRRTLTPLALRERYSALNEPGVGKFFSA